MALSAFLFDRALQKINDGTINLETMAVKAVLSTVTQALDKTFVGGSGDARYADLTNELTTTLGYTAGGVTLTGVAFSRPTALLAQITSAAFGWTITGAGITYKYCTLYVDGATNKDLLLGMDCENSGGSITTIAGPLTFTPGANGLVRWTQ